jgi:hypothetical protein
VFWCSHDWFVLDKQRNNACEQCDHSIRHVAKFTSRGNAAAVTKHLASVLE